MPHQKRGRAAQARRRTRRAASRAALTRTPQQALELVQAYADAMPCANCDHAMADHNGDNGACTFEDSNGMCGCMNYVAASESAQATAGFRVILDPDDETIAAAAKVIARGARIVPLNGDEASIPAETLRLRLENFVYDAIAPVDMPAQPTRDDRLALRWVADFVPEGVLTDDKRAMAPGSLSWRELPLSLMAMLETADGHDGARVSGRIDQVWRDGSMIKASGVFDNGDFGLDVARMVDDRTLRGISVDIAVSKHDVAPRSDYFDEQGNWAPRDQTDDTPSLADLLFDEDDLVFVVLEGVIGAATVCPFPAFGGASISLAASLVAGASDALWTFTDQNRFAITEQPCLCAEGEPHVCGGDNAEGVAGLTAAAAGLAPVAPPADWFTNPELAELTPLTIDDEGRIFGHAWAWDTCHIAYPESCTTAPHSNTGYAYFLLKEVLCDDGSRIPCGTITLDTGHADRSLGRVAATAHYDDTGCAAADVAFGEDEHGGWIAGALRPDVDAEKARVLRGAVLSGDWRNVNGHLELVGLLAVNVPGFPVPRARALVAAGENGEEEILALVAAGTVLGPTTAGITPGDLVRIAELRNRANDFAARRIAELAERARA